MPPADRSVYIAAAVEATIAYLTALSSQPSSQAALGNVLALTLLLPQLDPELDVFDRRFVLSLSYALVTALSATSKICILVQGTRKYGAIPLSVAGLRRTLEADLANSADEWGGSDSMASALRVADLEEPSAVADDDDVFVVITPCNATRTPVIDDVIALANRVGERPIILINPRLSDVPSAEGIMGVKGRGERNAFRDSWVAPFYMRLLFDAGTLYPLRAIVYRAYGRTGDRWQVWLPGEEMGEIDTFECMGEFEDRPRADEIDAVFARRRRERRLAAKAQAGGGQDGLDAMLTQVAWPALKNNVLFVAVLLAVVAFAALKYSP